MAKNNGKIFEDSIKKSAEKVKDLYFYRLRDSASSFNPTQGTGLRFTPSNDYDCFMYKHPHLFTLELKSTTTTSFSFQSEEDRKAKKTKMIKRTQIIGLQKAGDVDGLHSGFLFNFSKKGRTYWMDIHDFTRFIESTDKKSVNEFDISENGGILVDQKLLKTNYRYDIKKMISDIIKSK